MRPQSQDIEKQSEQPPRPGGDPSQQPQNLPARRPGQDRAKNTEDEKGVEGYGSIPKKEVPPAHQIYW